MVAVDDKLTRQKKRPATAWTWCRHLVCMWRSGNPFPKVLLAGSRARSLQKANWDTTAVVGFNGTTGTDAGESAAWTIGDDAANFVGGPVVWFVTVIFGDTGTAR